MVSRQVPLWPIARADALALALITAFGLFALAPQLSHPFIPLWDETMHQAATRGTLDTPLYPHIYVEHLSAHDPKSFWAADVWLNKPPVPFWLGAVMLKVVGVTPMALRLVSLFAALMTAGAIYLLGRALAGRLFALAAALLFLSLPFGWLLVQGIYFGDVTDCALAACNAVAIALVVASTERQSWRLAVAAGLVVGIGVLCKVMLAVTPLGVAGLLWALGRFKVCRGPKLWWVGAMTGAAAILAVPWNVYAAQRWPVVYWMHARTWLGHLAPVDGLMAEIGPWVRPVDAVFNELNVTELAPAPAALTLLAGLWLVAGAVLRKSAVGYSLAIWLWATWGLLSLSTHKVPAGVWGSLPAAIIAIALLFRDGVRFPPLGLAAIAALFTPQLVEVLPGLSVLREWLPDALEQTKESAGLAEGMFLAACAAGLGVAVTQPVQKLTGATLVLGAPGAVGLFVLLGYAQLDRAAMEEKHASKLWVSHTREVGLALADATPKKSVLYLDLDREPSSKVSLTTDAIFWSGRIAYLGAPDVTLAHEKGYHPWLVSPAAEPFEPVASVPANAWLRAYDLDKPTTAPSPLPDGVTPLAAQAGGMKVLGVASGPASGDRDRWAFFVSGPPEGLRVGFKTENEEASEQLIIAPDAVLRDAKRLKDAAWYVLPALGPRRGAVRSLEISGGPGIPLPR